MVTVGDKAFFDKIHSMPEAGLVFKRHYSPRFVRLTAAFVNQAGDRNQDHVYELSVVSNGQHSWLATATVDGHFIFHLSADSKSRAEALGFWALKGHLRRALRRTIRANRAKEVAV